MQRFFNLTGLTATILVVSASAFAAPTGYGHALRDQAAAGQLTPHGIWDSK